MSVISIPGPVKIFVAILGREGPLVERALAELCDSYGPVDMTSQSYPFDHTGYYNEEMGGELCRRFFAFQRLVSPQELAPLKTRAAKIEEQLAEDGQRTVNLDPGFIDFNKIVLASYKYGGQKIYLADGVWADLILIYAKGKFQTFAWTFPDFGTGRYEKFLLALRRRYKEQRRESE